MLEPTKMNDSPARSRLYLERGATTLSKLLEKGLRVRGKKGGHLQISFVQVGKIFRAREGTGWEAVRVRSFYGAESLLLHESGGVSGLLRLKVGATPPSLRGVEQDAGSTGDLGYTASLSSV